MEEFVFFFLSVAKVSQNKVLCCRKYPVDTDSASVVPGSSMRQLLYKSVNFPQLSLPKVNYFKWLHLCYALFCLYY